MTFKVGLLITANGKAAKAEIDGLSTSLRNLGPAAEVVSTKGRKAAQSTTAVAKTSAANA